MAKVTLNDIVSGFDSTTAYNTNNDLIETGFDNTLSRDGSSPNSMEADLDLNSNDVLNAQNVYAKRIYVNNVLTTVGDFITAGNQVQEFTATAGQTLISGLTTYVQGINAVQIFINGVHQAPSAFAETSTSSVTLSGALDFGDNIIVITHPVQTVNVANASAVQYTPSGGVTTNVADKLHEVISIKDFNIIGDGSDETTKIQIAVDYVYSVGAVLEVPYTVAGYGVTNITLPDNNFHIRGTSGKTHKYPKFNHLSTTGKMFSQAITPSAQPHSIIFENINLTGHASRTTSCGIWITEGWSDNAFNIQFINVYVDNFAVGVCAKNVFSATLRNVEVTNCDVGFYGLTSIANIIESVIPRIIPANGIGFWFLCSGGIVLGGDTSSASSGSSAWQYLVGNDTSATVPTNASSYITAEQITTNVTFQDTHFEFSDKAGAGTVQSGFVRVGSGSVANFNQCDFQNRTPNLPLAIEYVFLTKTSQIENCVFAIGPANVGPGNGSYSTEEVVITARDKNTGQLIITPQTFDTFPVVSGVSGSTDIVHYNGKSGAKASKSNTQTVTNSSSDTIDWNVESYDFHNEFDIATDTFTCTLPGLYQVELSVYLGGTNPPVVGKPYRVQLNKNGSGIARKDSVAVSVGQFSVSLSAIVELDAGDTLLAVLANLSSGASIDVGSDSGLNYFQIMKL